MNMLLVEMVRYARRYWPVVAFAVLVILGSGIFFVRRESRDGILSNAPLELLGIGISALVTVFVVDSALKAAEARQWGPLTDTILSRVRAHAMHGVALVSRKMREDLRPTARSVDHEARRDALGAAIVDKGCFSHLTASERQSMYRQISQSSAVLQSEIAIHQAVFSRVPDLYRAIVELERTVLGWSAYRDEDPDYAVTGEEESPTICQVAGALLRVDGELGKTPLTS